MSNDSYIDAQEKLMTINLLQLAKKEDPNKINFDTLESMKNYLAEKGVNVSIANLSRYIHGKALPKSKLKDKLLEILVENEELGLTIERLIMKHITYWPDSQGNIGVNNTHLLNDADALKAILFMAIQKGIIPRDVDKVITAEVDGIIVASTLANLLNTNCVYARKKKPVGFTQRSDTGEEKPIKVLSEDVESLSSGRVESLYFPENFIKKGENVIIVDDVIRSGSTQTALASLVRKCGGNVKKIIILVGIGKWDKMTSLGPLNYPFKALKVLHQPS